jgi:hypothetical protein
MEATSLDLPSFRRTESGAWTEAECHHLGELPRIDWSGVNHVSCRPNSPRLECPACGGSPRASITVVQSRAGLLSLEAVLSAR